VFIWTRLFQTGDGDAACGLTKAIRRLARVFPDIGDVTAIDPQNADVITSRLLPTVCTTWHTTGTVYTISSRRRSSFILCSIWVDEMRYLGLLFVRSHTFKCSLDHGKRSFYRAVNGIFGRIGRTASEEVVLELIKSKCLPILLYGLEVYPLNNTSLRSLDFSVNRFFKKLFNTSDIQTVIEC